MKKLSILTAVFVLGLGIRAQADTLTYLVNFGPNNSAAFSGDPGIFSDDSGDPLPSSTVIVNPGTSQTYSLGSYTLTLTGSTYSFGASGTTQTAVTHSFAYQTNGGSNVFTLTGLPAGDTIDFQFIGSSQPFNSLVSVAAGSTAPTVGTTFISSAPDSDPTTGLPTPEFTDVGTLTGSSTYSGVFTQFNGGEGDIAAAYITITTGDAAPAAAPEPSTYLMFGMGLSVLVIALRRKAKNTTV
jgi:hypothetical protein